MSRTRTKTRALLKIAGVVLLLLVVLLSVGLGKQRWMASKAMASRELIEATLSAQDSYTPPLEAPIAPDRLEVFLAVRADLAEYCPLITELSESFDRVAAPASAAEGSAEPPSAEQVREGAGGVGSAFRAIFRAAGKLNAYEVDRNEALLRHGLGLGEFTFVNNVACLSARGLTPSGFFGPKNEARVYTGRVAGQLREMIGRHATLLEGQIDLATPEARERMESRLAIWRGEYEALGKDPSRRVFADGLPPEIERVLRSFNDRLDRLCCPATSELDVARVVPSHAVWYDHR